MYEKIYLLQRIDLKNEKSKECMFCHYWFFKDKNFNFEKRVYNGCHDTSMMCYELKNIAIFKIKGVNHSCISWNTT